MTIISIQDKTLARRISSIAFALGITPDAVATGILYAHCMSAKERKKAPATPTTTQTPPTPAQEPMGGLEAMRALAKQLKQS